MGRFPTQVCGPDNRIIHHRHRLPVSNLGAIVQNQQPPADAKNLPKVVLDQDDGQPLPVDVRDGGCQGSGRKILSPVVPCFHGEDTHPHFDWIII